MGVISELVKVGSCNHRGLYMGKRTASVSVKKTQLAISGLRMKRPPAKKQRRPLEGEKGQESRFSSRMSRRNTFLSTS